MNQEIVAMAAMPLPGGCRKPADFAGIMASTHRFSKKRGVCANLSGVVLGTGRP